MNVQWQRHDHRLDVQLAVALELAAHRLARAKCPDQLDRAIVLNLRLWRAVRRLAERFPALDDREVLGETADYIAVMLVAEATPAPDLRDVTFVAGRNLALARDLAGETAANRARDHLVAEWSDQSAGRFDDWLVARLGHAAASAAGVDGRS